MIKKLVNNIKNIEKPILKVMFKGFKVSFVICILSLVILALHNTYPFSHIVYQSGLILFRTGLMIGSSFFVCAFVTDQLKNQKI